MGRIVQKAHSAKVRLRLRVNGHDLDVAQVGDGFCVLREPQPYPACDARLMITVDGRTETHRVFLYHGISADSREVAFL